MSERSAWPIFGLDGDGVAWRPSAGLLYGIPTTAVLHWKPERSLVPGGPDVHAVATAAWVVYPFKAGG